MARCTGIYVKSHTESGPKIEHWLHHRSVLMGVDMLQFASDI